MFERSVTTIGVVLSLLLFVHDARASCVGLTCSLQGNARIQNGGLPVPLTGAPIPFGRIFATPLATVMQGAIAPRSLVFGGGELSAPALSFTLPVFLANSNFFQLRTSLSASVPKGPAVFSASGRTGPAVVSWCPGFPVPGPNPLCGSPALGAPVPGRLVYTKTANQFGGPAAVGLGGTVNVAALVTSGAPCTAGPLGSLNPGCKVAFALANPGPTLAIGRPFGVAHLTAGAAPNPGLFYATVTAMGFVANLGAPLGPGLANPATSFGGPWTTGMLTVSVTPPSIFITTGTDFRSPSGAGIVSLVSGSVSTSTLTGPEANVAYLNLVVPEPRAVLGLIAALATLALCHFIVSSRSPRAPAAARDRRP